MHRMKTASTLALALAGMAAWSFGHAADGNIAVVNGVPVSQARVDYIVKTQVQQGQKDTPELRKNVADVLITREVLSQEAIKKGLDKDPAVVTQVDMAKQEFLIRAYFEDFIKRNPVTDEEIVVEYEKVKAEQSAGGQRKEYRARHILVKDEKQAKALLAQINKANGKNFAQLAKAKSEDTGSKKLGGELDWSDGSNYVKEFSDAMMKLNKGEWTKQPVKTKFGYHIILLEDVRPWSFRRWIRLKTVSPSRCWRRNETKKSKPCAQARRSSSHRRVSRTDATNGNGMLHACRFLLHSAQTSHDAALVSRSGFPRGTVLARFCACMPTLPHRAANRSTSGHCGTSASTARLLPTLQGATSSAPS